MTSMPLPDRKGEMISLYQEAISILRGAISRKEAMTDSEHDRMIAIYSHLSSLFKDPYGQGAEPEILTNANAVASSLESADTDAETNGEVVNDTGALRVKETVKQINTRANPTDRRVTRDYKKKHNVDYTP